MDKPSVFILGAGSVGSGLALALQDCGYSINGIWNRRETKNYHWLSDDFGFCVHTDLRAATALIQQSKIIFICVTDDCIQDVTSSLCSNVELAPETIITHLSGCIAWDEDGHV